VSSRRTTVAAWSTGCRPPSDLLDAGLTSSDPFARFTLARQHKPLER